jgi:hypothetical protein
LIRRDQPEGKGKEVVDVAQHVNQEGVQQEEIPFMAQTQGSIEVDAQKGEDFVKDMEDTSENKQPKVLEPLICHRCKNVGHIARDCRRGWQQHRPEQGNLGLGNRKDLRGLIAPLCAT